MLKTVFRHMQSSALPLATAFGMAGCTSLETHSDPSEKLVEIHDIRNAQGQSSRTTVVYNEWFETFVEKRTKGKKYSGKDLERMLPPHVADHLRKKGFSTADADKTANSIVEGFQAYLYGGIHLPAVAASDTMGNVYTDKPATSPECTVTQLPSVYNTEAWAKDTATMNEDTRPWKIPYDFRNEIFDFMRNHEIAHCMGADEPQADKVSAKLLLKRHPDKEKALAFLELLKTVRIADTLKQQGRDYQGTFLAVDRVIKDFKTHKTITQSAEEIWSEALERPDYGAEHVPYLKVALRPPKELIRSRDFKATAEFLINNVRTMESGPRKEVAVTIVEGMRHLGNIVEMPKSP